MSIFSGYLLIRNATQVVTCSGFAGKKGKEMSNVGVIENGAVAVEDGYITHVGPTQKVLKQIKADRYTEINAKGCTLIPGFVDSHTHFVFGGYRENEFAEHLKKGNNISVTEYNKGVLNTMKATRESTYGKLYDPVRELLDEMFHMGITTIEGKTGYGLEKWTEIRQLRIMDELRSEYPVDIISTFMAAHAIPPEYEGRPDKYVDYIIEDILPEVHNEHTAKFFDVFCEPEIFSVKQCERLLKAGRSHRFKLKVHADEFTSSGGAELAVKMKAFSADHLINISDNGIKSLAQSDVIATLLPLTSLSSGRPYAPARKLIEAGCAVALATDFNPCSNFSFSIPLLFALACLKMRMTPEEALTALTINGAAALNMAKKTGSIDIGKKADMVLLKFPSDKFLPYHAGMNIVEIIIKDGILYML